jgi:transcriptional repressor NrdR
MICPKCNKNETKVLDSRETDGQKAIRRRRECEGCKQRFTTFERMDTGNFVVIKRDGSRENYDREKVERGIWVACQKRKVTQEQVEDVLNMLEEKCTSIGKEVPSKIIGEEIMNALMGLDEIAYIRFASVYRQFKDIESFKKALDKLTK